MVKTQLWIQFPVTNKHTCGYHHREQSKTFREELSPSSYSVPPASCNWQKDTESAGLHYCHPQPQGSLFSSCDHQQPKSWHTKKKKGTSLSRFLIKIQTHSLGAKDPHRNEQILRDCLISPWRYLDARYPAWCLAYSGCTTNTHSLTKIILHAFILGSHLLQV